MRKFSPFFFLIFLFFSCENERENSLPLEEKKLWEEINRMDSFPDNDVFTRIKYFRKYKSGSYQELYLNCLDSVLSDYAAIKERAIKDFSRKIDFNYLQIYSGYKRNVKKLISNLNQRNFLRDDYNALLAYWNKLDGLYGYSNRTLYLYALLQLSFLKQKCLWISLGSITNQGGCFLPGFNFRKVNDSVLVFAGNFGKDIPRGSFVEMELKNKIGKKEKLGYLPWAEGTPEKSTRLFYAISYSGDFYSINLKDSLLPKGKYKLINWLFLHQPTGTIDKFFNETEFEKK